MGGEREDFACEKREVGKGDKVKREVCWYSKNI